MKLFNYTKPAMIIAEEGKHIRSVDDVYKEAYVDENGNAIDEHFPYYATVIFVPSNTTEEQMNELYIEEDIEE